MLIVETIARIRREHFVQRKTVKEIVRTTGWHGTTIRGVPQSEATSFEYEPTIQPKQMLGRWTADEELPESRAPARVCARNRAHPVRSTVATTWQAYARTRRSRRPNPAANSHRCRAWRRMAKTSSSSEGVQRKSVIQPEIQIGIH
jgi:hypothetical protein